MSWTTLKAAGTEPFPLEKHTAVLTEGLIFVFGGRDLKTGRTNNSLTVLNTGIIVDIEGSPLPSDTEIRWIKGMVSAKADRIGTSSSRIAFVHFGWR
jgi:hypothetical protein